MFAKERKKLQRDRGHLESGVDQTQRNFGSMAQHVDRWRIIAIVRSSNAINEAGLGERVAQHFLLRFYAALGRG
jgi:hypothetical protein